MVLGQIQSGVGGGDAREWLEEGRRKCFNENYCTPFIYIYIIRQILKTYSD